MSGRKLQIDTAEVFLPLLEPARDKGAHGGRGSGKSQFFADLAIEDGQRFPGDAGEGMRMIAAREVQKSLKESAKRLLEAKLAAHRLGEADGWKVYMDRIQTPGDGVIIFQGLQDHTAESVKSFEGFHRFWAEEAQTISHRSVELVRPTIRWEDTARGLESEMWWSWNPRRKTDAVDMMLRGNSLPTNAIVVEANWSDNPWFPNVLEKERLDCLNNKPEQYDHIWNGGYATVLTGAYYAQSLQVAKQEGRIGNVAFDPNLSVRIFCDIGGTGAKADAFTMWPTQWVDREIRYRDYYESQGQPAAAHLAWLRSKHYTPDKATIYLPHDGVSQDKVYDVSYESVFRSAGYDVVIIPNQGKGAAMARIEESRRLFPQMWFDKKTTEAGRDALGWYHAKKDDTRNIDLGPNHDWASHGADAFGMSAVAYKPPSTQVRRDPRGGVSGGWMG